MESGESIQMEFQLHQKSEKILGEKIR